MSNYWFGINKVVKLNGVAIRVAKVVKFLNKKCIET
jgi:hypothetical protein